MKPNKSSFFVYLIVSGELVWTGLQQYQMNQRVYTLSDENSTTCLSASLFKPGLSYLKVRFAWPGMPRATLDFNVEVYGKPNLTCESIRVYVPPLGAHSKFLDFSENLKYKICPFTRRENTVSNVKCDFQCTCTGTICDALYLLVLDKHTEICEVVFPAQ